MLGPMVPVQSRLVPNPCIGVGELMKPLLAFQKLHGAEADIAKLIVPKQSKQITWKTAPNMSWLVGLKSLLRPYLEIATNAVLPSKKHKTAILNLCKEVMPAPLEKAQLNKTKHSNDDFSDLIDMYIRIACAQLRVLRTDEVQAARAWSKASEAEKNAVQELLALIDPESKHSLIAAASPAVPPIPSSWQVVVADDASQVPPTSSSSVLVPDPAVVFKRVLDKKISDSLSPIRYAGAGSQPVAQQKSFLEPTLSLEEEAQLLAAARQQEPLAKGNKSLLARVRANNRKTKKSASQKKEASGNLKKEVRVKKKPKATKASISSSTPSTKPMKRLMKKTAELPATDETARPPATDETAGLPNKKAEAVEVDKVIMRRRALSNAYHKARVLALKEAFQAKPDMTDEEKKSAETAAKAKAQEAYKAAAEAFN